MDQLSPSAEAAVDAAYMARRSGSPLGLLDVGDDVDTALELQLEVAGRFASEGDPIAGWKLGMTSGPSRDAMGPGVRPHGYVLRSRIFDSGDRVALTDALAPGIEPEICVMIGAELGGSHVGIDEVMSAVRGVAASFELLETRVTSNGEKAHTTKIIDGLSNWGLVLGDEVPVEEYRADTTMRLSRDDEMVGTATAGADLQIDDVFESVATLCRLLAVHGISLEPGQAVLTGAFLKLPIDGPATWSARFDGIGGVSVVVG